MKVKEDIKLYLTFTILFTRYKRHTLLLMEAQLSASQSACHTGSANARTRDEFAAITISRLPWRTIPPETMLEWTHRLCHCCQVLCPVRKVMDVLLKSRMTPQQGFKNVGLKIWGGCQRHKEILNVILTIPKQKVSWICKQSYKKWNKIRKWENFKGEKINQEWHWTDPK